jgi:hypothetical protein
MVRYLLVDDRDGGVIAELASGNQALRLLARLERTPDGGGAPISVVRIDSGGGGLGDASSMVAMRPLPPLMATSGAATPERLNR